MAQTVADHLDAIAADPDADAPLLAFASWLEANGDPERGEFLRLTVEAERQPGFGAARAAASHRLSELQRKHYKAWQQERPALGGGRWQMERGVFDTVSFDSFAAFDKDRSRLPAVRLLSFNNLRSPARLFACPDLGKARGLRLVSCGLPPDGCILLARCPHLGHLERLELSGCSLNEESLLALAEAPWLPRLRRLSLRGDYHGRGNATLDSLRALFASPALAGLRRLQIARIGLGEAGAAMLFSEASFTGLERLDLQNENLGPAALAPLADAVRFPRLWRVEMERNRLGAEGTRLLGRLPALRWLDASNNLLGNAGAEALADDEGFRGLVLLSVSSNAIGDAGAEALARSAVLGNLEHLDLSSNLIDDEGLLAFGTTTGLPKLTNFISKGNSSRTELATEVAERLRTGGPPLVRKAAPAPVVAAAPARPLVRVGDADEDGLLEAIVSDPEDDLPRLVYADWLEEQGESGRAELIRAGTAPKGPEGQAEYNALVKRVAPEIPEEFAKSIHRLVFTNGLLAAVVQMRGLLTRAFQERGGPWLRQARTFKLCIVGTTKSWEKVAAMPLLGHVRNLDVSNCQLGREGLAGLLTSPHLRGLFALNLAGNRLSRPETLKPLAETGSVPRLINLDLSSNWLNMEGVRALLQWPQTPRLAALSLAGNWIHSTGVALLAGSSALDGLRYLSLSHNYLHDPAVQALVQGGGLPNLAHLVLAGNSFTDAAAHALAGSA
ncbi:MAG: TIGR02996 domain-containing protein, partial [Gemmataceae bacterium]|nr:TIGR02996 domain-containing protein [Gemmataceae bacterium]